MVLTMEREVIEENPAPIRLSPPHITNGLARNWTQAPAPYCIFIYHSVCHAWRPHRVPKRAIDTVPSTASSCYFQYILFSLRSPVA